MFGLNDVLGLDVFGLLDGRQTPFVILIVI